MADYGLLAGFKGIGGAQREAEQRALETQVLQAKLAASARGADLPSNVQEYEYFNKLDPASQTRYLQMKRADKILDTGGGFSRFDPITGGALPVYTQPPAGGAPNQQPQPLVKTLPPNQQPQNVEDEIRNKLRTEELYKAEQSFPSMQAKVNSAVNQIEAVKNDPALEWAVGTWNSRLPNVRGSTADFENKIKQLQGGAFLEAYQSLKGGGAITEVEGAKAEQAIARMQLSASEEGFKAALDDFKAAVTAGLKRQQERIAELKGQSYALPTLNKGAIDATPTGLVDPEIDAILTGVKPKVKLGSIPTQAVKDLRANPNTAALFDEVFGAGASKMVLGR